MNAKPDALKLARVPIVDRGIRWQADATQTLNAQAAEIAALEAALKVAGEALQLAVRQNEHDMLMTGTELRQCDAALQQIKEAQL